MKTKPTPNAKDPAFEAPVELPGVLPEDYDSSIDSGSGSALRDQEGTESMNPQMGGHGKAEHNNTTSFGPVAPENSAVPARATGGQEEQARPRQPNTSSNGRIKLTD